MTGIHDDNMPDEGDRYAWHGKNQDNEPIAFGGLPVLLKDDANILGGQIDSARSGNEHIGERLVQTVLWWRSEMDRHNCRPKRYASDLVRAGEFDADTHTAILTALAGFYRGLRKASESLAVDEVRGVLRVKNLDGVIGYLGERLGPEAPHLIDILEKARTWYEEKIVALQRTIEVRSQDLEKGNTHLAHPPKKLNSLEELREILQKRHGEVIAERYLFPVEKLLRDYSRMEEKVDLLNDELSVARREIDRLTYESPEIEPKAPTKPSSIVEYFRPGKIRARMDSRASATRAGDSAVFNLVHGKDVSDEGLVEVLGIQPYQDKNGWPSDALERAAPGISRLVKAVAIYDWLENNRDYGPQFDNDLE